jgi:hypothetical protein
MAKIKLDLSTLEVQSFRTTPVAMSVPKDGVVGYSATLPGCTDTIADCTDSPDTLDCDPDCHRGTPSLDFPCDTTNQCTLVCC